MVEILSVWVPASMFIQRPGGLAAVLEDQHCLNAPFEGWLGATRKAPKYFHAPRGALLKFFLCVSQQACFSRDPAAWRLCWRSRIVWTRLPKGGLVLPERQLIISTPLGRHGQNDFCMFSINHASAEARRPGGKSQSDQYA